MDNAPYQLSEAAVNVSAGLIPIHGHLALFSTEGFSGPEETGRWTEGPQASFTCRFPAGVKKDDDWIVEITASGYSPSGKAQSVLLSANNGPPKYTTLTKRGRLQLSFHLTRMNLSWILFCPTPRHQKNWDWGVMKENWEFL